MSHLLLSQDQGSLGITIIETIEALTLESSDDVVSDNVDLMETTKEGLGCGDVIDITQTEDVGVFIMSQGFSVDGEHVVGFSVDQARIYQNLMRFAGRNDVEVVVLSGLFLTGLDVSEDGSLGCFINLDQIPSVVDINTNLLGFGLDEGISLLEVLGELIVGIHDSERVLGGQFT